ncbi:MAG: nuclear transport factor 2 family protein, partial [Actinomycetota bacterium]|nr:nuclear transport factor 2 family protein [Actinomycetota bacterium]
PTTSDEYAALEQELAQANQDLAEAEVLLAEAAAEQDAAAELSKTIAQVEANETAKIEAWLAKDIDAMTNTFTDDVVMVDETFRDHTVGMDEWRRINGIVIKFADPDATKVVDRFVSEDGTRAVAVWEWIGSNFYGKPFDLPFVLIHEYRDGKVAKQSIYYASPDAYGQLTDQ